MEAYGKMWNNTPTSTANEGAKTKVWNMAKKRIEPFLQENKKKPWDNIGAGITQKKSTSFNLDERKLKKYTHPPK